MSSSDSDLSRWFAEEVLPHEAALRSFLVGRFPSLSDVEDIVQNSLAKVFRVRETTSVNSPKALLFTTARNLALDAVRRQRRVGFESIEEAGGDAFAGGEDVVESVCRLQELELLRSAIGLLPDRCRQVLTLRTAYGLSQKEIALRLGISENTVEKQMAKGIRRCTEFFALHGLP